MMRITAWAAAAAVGLAAAAWAYVWNQHRCAYWPGCKGQPAVVRVQGVGQVCMTHLGHALGVPAAGYPEPVYPDPATYSPEPFLPEDLPGGRDGGSPSAAGGSGSASAA